MIADTGGGANGAALAADGGFLVTQNGGIDFSIFQIFGELPAAPLRAVGPAAGGARRARELPHPEPLQMPNDLCVAPDGTVFFTDPIVADARTRRPGASSPSIPTARCGSSPTGSGRRTGSSSTLDDETLIVVENGRER